MTNQEFLGTMERLGMFAAVMDGEDLAGFIERCERSEAFGCFVATPQQYQVGQPRVTAMKRIAEECQRVQRVYREAKAVFAETEKQAAALSGREVGVSA